MTIANNIKKIRAEFNLTQDELGAIAGVSGGAVSTWERGTAEPRMGAVQKISDYLKISKADIVEDSYDTSYRENSNEIKSIRIPVLGSVPAGIPIEAVEDIIDWEDIPKEWTNGDREYFALRVKGDSMYPKYLEGDTIIIRKENDCESGQDCIVYVNGYDATLKRVLKRTDHIMLQPLNSKYEPRIYDYNDEHNKITVAGIVVEIRRKV